MTLTETELGLAVAAIALGGVVVGGLVTGAFDRSRRFADAIAGSRTKKANAERAHSVRT